MACRGNRADLGQHCTWAPWPNGMELQVIPKENLIRIGETFVVAQWNFVLVPSGDKAFALS